MWVRLQKLVEDRAIFEVGQDLKWHLTDAIPILIHPPPFYAVGVAPKDMSGASCSRAESTWADAAMTDPDVNA